MEMAAVRAEGGFAVQDAAGECEGGVAERQAEDGQGDHEGDDRVRLEQAGDGDDRHGIAEEERAGVAHEDLRGIGVEG